MVGQGRLRKGTRLKGAELKRGGERNIGMNISKQLKSMIDA